MGYLQYNNTIISCTKTYYKHINMAMLLTVYLKQPVDYLVRSPNILIVKKGYNYVECRSYNNS